MSRLDVRITPLVRDSRVFVDGQDISGCVQRIVIVAKIGDVTRVFLTCIKTDREPFVIKGRLVPDVEEAIGV